MRGKKTSTYYCLKACGLYSVLVEFLFAGSELHSPRTLEFHFGVGDISAKELCMTVVSSYKRIRLVVLFALGVCLGTADVRASVHLAYDVIPISGFQGSWLHSATGSEDAGSPLNGPRWNGDDISDRISGGFQGDLEDNILSNITGSVSGKLGQLAGYLNTVTSSGLSTADMFELKLGQAAGGVGVLQFETDGVGSGQFSGGVLSFSLIVGTDSVLDGTFFFKPQAETASGVLTPNRGDSDAFTVWGLNWMHDGEPQEDGTEPNWLAFLGDLDPGVTTLVDRPAVTLGIAMYAVDPPGAGPANPEPATVMIWGLLGALGMTAYRRVRS